MDHSRGRNIALRRAGARPSASRQPPSRVVAAKLETAGCGTRAVETKRGDARVVRRTVRVVQRFVHQRRFCT